MLAVVPLAVASAEMRPMGQGVDDWFGNPLLWNVRGGGVSVVSTNGSGILAYEAGGVSEEVCVEASLTMRVGGRRHWDLAAVAIVDDEQNFWHLALGRTPQAQGYRPFIELCEMREGQWLAQTNLKWEQGQGRGSSWDFGRTYRLRLRMDKQGITGTVTDADGQVMFSQRYVFTAPAVTCGRPALRVADMACEFTGLASESGAAAAGGLRGRRPVVPPYRAERVAVGAKEDATGFFRVKQEAGGGRWRAIDPLGQPVVLLGVDHVTFGGHWCEKLGYAPHGRKNEKKYASRGEWEAETLGRLKAWGFNMLGAGCDPQLNHRGLVHTVFLSLGNDFTGLGDACEITPDEQRPCSAFPNVFHPDFEAFCKYRARRSCLPHKDDPWLFGYFIDNELAWWGRGAHDAGLFDAVMKKGETHTAKTALRDFLKAEAKGDIAQFNALWGTSLKTFDEMLALNALPHNTEARRSVKLAFLRLIAERYFSVTTRAIRAVDPNHLVLGSRFAGTTWGAHPAVWEVSGTYCDVVTFNCYPMADLDEEVVYTDFSRNGEPVMEHFKKYYGYVKRPMLVTEWSFPALDAGLPSVHGAGQRFFPQAERTAATSLFARSMLSLPFLLGYDYFMWVDEPALGISTPFPEDSNYGLINEDGEPYALLVAMFTELHRDASRVPAPKPLRTRTAAARIPDAMAVAKKGAEKGAPPAAYTADGTSFKLENGIISLSGKIAPGRMVQAVTEAKTGALFGEYNAMLHVVVNGESRWIDAGHVIAVQGRTEDGVAVAEITSSASQGDTSFELTHRLMLPQGSPWFVSEFVSAKNTGTAPLAVKGLYFRVYSPFTGTPDALPPDLWGVPASGCWMDKADGRFFGAAANRKSGIQVHFWKDGTYHSLHPDARLDVDLRIAPGEMYRPAMPVHLICATGIGNSAAWLALQKSLALLF